ncbi:MAG: DinB family protein [Bacillota bacterium]
MPTKRKSPADPDETLRQHLLELLQGGGAHLDFDTAVADLPAKLRGAKPPGQPHTPWRLVEHMRITQWDILEFSRNPQHQSPPWPQGYWPLIDAPDSPATWDRSLASFRADNAALQDLVRDPATDLLTPFPHGQGQTLAREVMLAADHTAYHLGQLIILRRLLGAWHE